MEENINIQRGGTPVQTQPQQTQQATATFDFPTQVISLPSEGRVYPESNPLSKGTLEIKYMTAREEDILADRNLINKGIVLQKLLESVVVQPGVNSDDLVVGDINAVYLATRMLGYGPEYDVEVTDPFSGEKQKVTIDLSTIQTKDIDFSKLNKENRYELVLPVSKKKLIVRLLTHKDEKDINQEIQALERLTKGKSVGTDVTTRFKYMIVEVDGNSDRGFINKFVPNMLAGDTKALRTFFKEISPDLDMTFQFTSEVTGDVEALSIPFGISFFYPTT
jgi:hypothetical protein